MKDPQVSMEITLPRHFHFLNLLQCPSLLLSFFYIPRPVSLFTIPGITQLTGYIAPVLCYRANRQRRSHCSPNLPALHIQVEPKQILFWDSSSLERDRKEKQNKLQVSPEDLPQPSLLDFTAEDTDAHFQDWTS